LTRRGIGQTLCSFEHVSCYYKVFAISLLSDCDTFGIDCAVMLWILTELYILRDCFVMALCDAVLQVLETCVKNCGMRFHVFVAQKEFLQELVKLAMPRNNPPHFVLDKVLGLIQVRSDLTRCSSCFKCLNYIRCHLSIQWAPTFRNDHGGEISLFPFLAVSPSSPSHPPISPLPLPPLTFFPLSVSFPFLLPLPLTSS